MCVAELAKSAQEARTRTRASWLRRDGIPPDQLSLDRRQANGPIP